MKILALETSCDETGAAVLEKKDGAIKVLSNVIATSSDMHAKTGGIIPENASREQAKAIIPVIIEALVKSKTGGATGRPPSSTRSELSEQGLSDGGEERQDPSENWLMANDILKNYIDAIAITYGPGLIGSLLVGVETAKTLSFALNKPIIPVNHLLAHIFANFIQNTKYKIPNSTSPFIGLIVSGGHTDLLYFETLNKFKWLGGTRDDAAGEAIDKIGRLLNLPYPAGPEMERRANEFQKLNAKHHLLNVKFQSPLINSDDFDFSFSGLKAEAARFIEEQHLTKELTNEICHSIQDAIFKVLVKKTVQAATKYNCKQILLGGGVSANKTLLNEFKSLTINNKLPIKVFSPEKIYSTDNAAMIGAYALLNYKTAEWRKIIASPELYFS